MHAEDHDSNHLVYTRKTVNTQRLRLHSQSFIPNGYHARESAAPKCVLFTPPVGPQWIVRLPFFRRVRSTLSPFCLPKHQIASWSWSLFDGVSLELRWNPQAALRILECEVPCPLPLHSRVSFIAARPSGHMDCLHSTKLRTTQDCDPSCSKVDQHFDAISWPENGVISKYTSLFLITCGTTRLVEFTLQIGKLGSFRNALTRSSCNCKKKELRNQNCRIWFGDARVLSESTSHVPFAISTECCAKRWRMRFGSLCHQWHLEKETSTLPPSRNVCIPSRSQSPNKSACALQAGEPRSTKPATTHRGRRPQW